MGKEVGEAAKVAGQAAQVVAGKAAARVAEVGDAAWPRLGRLVERMEAAVGALASSTLGTPGKSKSAPP